MESNPAYSPPHLRTIYALAALFTFMAATQALNAIEHFHHPAPPWMTTAPRWYDDVLGAFWPTSAVGACVSYARYRRRLARAGLPATPRPWQLRRESRFLLYLLAGTSLVQPPLYFYRTIVALNDPTTPAFARTFTSLFPFGSLLGIGFGLAIIFYDRNRVIREKRLTNHLCLTCGYDLRATPAQCPECGATPARQHPE